MWTPGRAAERLPHLLLVLGVEKPEEQAHGDRLDIGVATGVHGRADRLLVEGDQDAVLVHSLPDGEPKLARDKRGRTIPGQVVERRAVLACRSRSRPGTPRWW